MEEREAVLREFLAQDPADIAEVLAECRRVGRVGHSA